jgi:hypothetical protein
MNNNFYYNNCTKYFSGNVSDNVNNISMSTPFIFNKKNVEEMIQFIEIKECNCFDVFFMSNKSITEFYLYSSFIEFKKYNNYKFKEIIHTTIHSNPNEEWSKIFVYEKKYLDPNWKIFGLHRKAVSEMDNEYKQQLIKMYEYFYCDDCKYIKDIIN